MQNIKEHIKQNKYKSVYLLYGSEDYLKKLYKNKLKISILDQSDEMNYSYFEGKNIDVYKVIAIAETLPFFSDRRLIIIENSGLFKAQSDLADYMKEVPETTHFVFVESEVDRRNRLFKAVKNIGTISLMDGMDERNLKLWIASILAKDKKKITGNSIAYLLEKVGIDMENLSNEIEKLICYAIDREVISNEDIDAVCVTQVTSKIFQMIDAIAMKKQNTALSLYYDLLILKERPLSILYLITRHFNILLQIKELTNSGYNNSVMSQKVGIPPFTVGKYVSQSKNFTKELLMKVLKSCTDTEEQIKTGRLIDQMSIELLIVEYSS
jgi:DNA polymerase III subunit delta